MSTKEHPAYETAIRYGSYPLIVGATALVLFGGLAAGWPYFPTVPLTVAAALASVALLERRLPFHTAWGRDHRDSVCDAIHAVVNLVVLLAATALLLPWHRCGRRGHGGRISGRFGRRPLPSARYSISASTASIG